jgi:hypothetical protein
MMKVEDSEMKNAALILQQQNNGGGQGAKKKGCFGCRSS